MTELEQLQATRALITAPEHFTQSAMARTRDGKPCWPLAPDAVCWCITGAWLRVGDYRRSSTVLTKLSDAHNPMVVNDEDGHAAVLAMLDRAIAQRLEVA